MGEQQPRENETVQPVSWHRTIAPLFVVLVLAGVFCRHDVHLSWPGTALVLVVIVVAYALYWRFMTRKVVPSLIGRHRTWQTRSGRLKLTVTCKSCGNSLDTPSRSCPSCGQEIGHTS